MTMLPSDGLELWHWRDQRLLRRLTGRSDAGVVWSTDGQYLAFAGRLWRIDPTRGTLTEERNLDRLGPDTMSGTKRVAAHPTQPLLAVADTHGVITLLDMDTKQILWSVRTPHVSITSLVFSPDGRFVASGGGYQEETAGIDPAIRLWRVADGQLVQTLPARDLDTVEMITISADNRWIAALTYESHSLFDGLHSQVRVWKID